MSGKSAMSGKLEEGKQKKSDMMSADEEFENEESKDPGEASAGEEQINSYEHSAAPSDYQQSKIKVMMKKLKDYWDRFYSVIARIVGIRREYVMLWDFVKDKPDEISMKQGDRVYLLKEAISPGFRWRWVLIRDTQTETEGFVPRSYLALKEAFDMARLYRGNWYFGTEDTMEAEFELREEKHPVGSFMVCAPEDMKVQHGEEEFQEFYLAVKVEIPDGITVNFHKICRDRHGRYYLNKGEYTPNLYTLIFRLRQNPGKLGSDFRLRYSRYLKGCPEGVPPPPIPARVGRLTAVGAAVDARPNTKIMDMDEVNKMDKKMLAIFLEPYGLKREDLIFTELLGEGNFGVVRKARWVRDRMQEEIVAVKELKGENTATNWGEFEKEAVIMSQLSHPNIVRFYGFCREMQPYLIVTEFVNMGCLDKYLQEQQANGEPLASRAQISIMFQVARGMAYVERRGLVHRDLAGRNCLVSKAQKGQVLVKIADFGLAVAGKHKKKKKGGDATEKGEGEYPWKWMAIEAIKKKEFTTKTDVWAFGIVMIEIVTHGGIPYYVIPNDELLAYLEEGGREEQPIEMDGKLYDIAFSCWDANPMARPTFKELQASLSERLNRNEQDSSDNITLTTGASTDIELGHLKDRSVEEEDDLYEF